jgi:hypothetical protein
MNLVESSAGDLTLEVLQRAFAGTLRPTLMRCVFVPKGEVWLVDSRGRLQRLVNVGTVLTDADAESLCMGEMR